MTKMIGCVLCVLATVGCSSAKIQDYANETPVLRLEEYLSGTIDAYGIFKDRSGMVKKRFHVVIVATWQEGVGTLNEQFDYSDGTHSQRIWTIRKREDGKYIGTAGDVVGEAVGEVAGNALRWKYVLALDVDGKIYHVNFDDWMYLMDNRVMLNQSKMTKWGFDLGEVLLTFYKR